ncbi:MAG TPA: hypothetical protein VGN26_12620 [Armatimonadota bacterium]|jgi:hypothetical protein
MTDLLALVLSCCGAAALLLLMAMRARERRAQMEQDRLLMSPQALDHLAHDLLLGDAEAMVERAFGDESEVEW